MVPQLRLSLLASSLNLLKTRSDKISVTQRQIEWLVAQWTMYKLLIVPPDEHIKNNNFYLPTCRARCCMRSRVLRCASQLRRLSCAPEGPLRVGVVFERSRVFTDADVASFAALTGDSNPIHTSEARKEDVVRYVLTPGCSSTVCCACCGLQQLSDAWLAGCKPVPRHHRVECGAFAQTADTQRSHAGPAWRGVSDAEPLVPRRRACGVCPVRVGESDGGELPSSALRHTLRAGLHR